MDLEFKKRHQDVLGIIIEEYIETAEPVGSRLVAKRLNLSSATIRNVMADLEDMGVITHPHTSAGRIPTDKGYRYYIDTLMRVRKVNEATIRAVSGQYRLAMRSLEDVLETTSYLISNLTNYVGMHDAASDRSLLFIENVGNLVSSPGSGKTSLLVRTVSALAGSRSVAVVEGDQQTSNDADRIRATGVAAVQVNTGKGCHLEAPMVARALDRLPLGDGGVLFIENVGNLVCPALFDLGEAAKVAILSVTEGEDKPLKYPDMFRAEKLMLVNKVDLLPYLDFDVALCEANARKVNPGLEVIRVSARTGEGFDDWLAWIARAAA